MPHSHWSRDRCALSPSAISLVLGMLLTAGGQAAPATSVGKPKGYYLALGDSISYGFQPTAWPGAGPPAFDSGYVDVFASRLREGRSRDRGRTTGAPGSRP